MENVQNSSFGYIKKCNFSGHDPFDGLNSEFLKKTPLNQSPFVRLCWIQFFKHFPFNLRGVFGVAKEFNPKAGALFILGYIKCYQSSKDVQCKKECFGLFERLKDTVIKREKGVAWGYTFDWQAKAFYVPKGTPNIVSTVFIGHALIDMYETFQCEEAKQYIIGIRDFILNEMILWQTMGKMCFAYIPGQKAEVHNANLLAAALSCRMAIFLNDPSLNKLVAKAVNFSIANIKEDGFWSYGTMAHHRWMDNFHTAFNLEALLEIRRQMKTSLFDSQIKRVFRYYADHFFLDDGTPKYYHNKLYPIDIHTIAVAILFFAGLIEHKDDLFTDDDMKTAERLMEANVNLATSQFWDKRGYFYYQKGRFLTNKIPYMRWSQAWMFYALASYLFVTKKDLYAKTC